MKIAINTINDYSNYGNRLQNYALQQVLVKLGHDVMTLRNYSSKVPQKHLSIFEKVRNKIQRKEILSSLENLVSGRRHRYKVQDELKREAFEEFSREHIRESNFSIDTHTTCFPFDEGIDCYIIGSDQVWNYEFDRFSSRDFIDYSKKPKISYAASFGVSVIPDSLKEMYRSGLEHLDYISVRESAGQRLVKEISGRNSELVLDPTLLLKKGDWQDLIKNRTKYDEKYVLTYFLSEPKELDAEYVKKMAKCKGLKIKSLVNRDNPKLWAIDPVEFVNLFSQAEMVVTDSFHACVFSMIFQRNFEVFERNNDWMSMNSRIDTLLSSFDLGKQAHSVSGRKDCIDYDYVQDKLDELRQKSLNFLANSLSKIENDKKNGSH